MAIERITPGTPEWEQYYGNHISRYHFAIENLAPKHPKLILDVACGVGYGSFELSKIVNTKVVSVDRSEEALKYAISNFKSNNIDFIKDDCTTLNNIKKYGKFDAIVSFETLEHLDQPDIYLKLCYDLLKDDGVLIISTPNINVTSPTGKVKWEFHEKEYTANEFVEIMNRAGFSKIKMYGQHLSGGGKQKIEIINYLNILKSNPFIRLGSWFQKIFKGHKIPAFVFMENKDDFEFTDFKEPREIDKLLDHGPFVLVALASK